MGGHPKQNDRRIPLHCPSGPVLNYKQTTLKFLIVVMTNTPLHLIDKTGKQLL
jgi:hypothetical protein